MRLVLLSDKSVSKLEEVLNLNFRGDNGIKVIRLGRNITISGADSRLRQPMAAGGGSGIGIKTVRVASVTTSFFSCRDIDDAGAPIGDPFDVYPWVVDTGPVTGYNLNATGLPRVLPKYSAGHFIRIYSSQLSLRQQAPGVITPRWWAVDTFHLIGCNN